MKPFDSVGLTAIECVLCVSHSVVSNSATAWTVARQATLSMGFSRQEHWSGLPFPSPEDLPHPGIKPWPRASQADFYLSYRKVCRYPPPHTN